MYDVLADHSEKFYPHTDTSRIVNVGDPVLIGVKPEPIYDASQNNVNPIYKHSCKYNEII